VLLKKIKITPFKDFFWKIRIQQRKEMLSMHVKIPTVKTLDHILPVLVLIPQERTKMEAEKWKNIAFDFKTRVGQPSGATKYKKYVRKFEEGNPQEWIDMPRDLEEIWTQNSMAGGMHRSSTVRALLSAVALRQPSKMLGQQKRIINCNQCRTHQPSLECSNRDSFPASDIGHSASLDEEEDI
jgi:hypothetical protein